MNLFLLKALAVALTLSQILTQPDVKTSFSPETDREEVRKILRQGCDHMRGVLGQINPVLGKIEPGQFLAQQMVNAERNGQSQELMPGLTMADAKLAFDLFCTDASLEQADKILSEVIGYYNLSMYDLPDVAKISPANLTGFSTVLDGNDQHLTDLYRSSRRKVIPLAQIPQRVRDAFLSAEDQDFYKHKGVDETGVLRAGLKNMMKQSENQRDQGGSTLTQQLVKNLLLSGEVTYERKMREMVLAYRLEKTLSKDQIFELYLNYVLLGRSAWGVGMASEAYFGKPLDQLSVAEAAFLAGMPKGPAYYNPDKYSERSYKRTAFVLEQMTKNKVITKEEYDQALVDAKDQKRIAYVSPTVAGAGHFLDELSFQINKQVGVDPRESVFEIRSTLQPNIQKAAESALQNGLTDFEMRTGRAKYSGPETNVDAEVAKVKLMPEAERSEPEAWLTVLKAYRPKLTDVSWATGIVLSVSKGKVQVGLRDGQSYGLGGGPKGALAGLKVNDIVYVKAGPSAKERRADLMFVPEVQGAAVVLENSTGRVLAMVGGFSHGTSRWNRAVDMLRQPGSIAKPLTYLAALNLNLQPNTLVWDSPVELQPVSGRGASWSPSNYESKSDIETVTLRKGLEDSRNRVTARVASSMTMNDPGMGLDWILELMKECGYQEKPQRYWPVILGSQETSLMKVASCYSTLANAGLRVPPHVIREVKREGQVVMDESQYIPTQMRHTDTASIFQLRNMLQGVVARGTARTLNKNLQEVVQDAGGGRLSDYVAGKTGTSQGSNDAWFAGFTQDITVVVWVGYDNGAKDKRRNLGADTGGSVAVPIFADILRGSLETYPLKAFAPLSGPDANVLVPLAGTPDGYLYHLEDMSQVRNAAVDYIRVDGSGQIIDTREYLLKQDNSAPAPNLNFNDPYAVDDNREFNDQFNDRFDDQNNNQQDQFNDRFDDRSTQPAQPTQPTEEIYQQPRPRGPFRWSDQDPYAEQNRQKNNDQFDELDQEHRW